MKLRLVVVGLVGAIVGLAGTAIVSLMTVRARTQRPESSNASTSERAVVTRSQVDRWMTELSNWGRWGKDDQLGTLNLVTPAKRQQAMALAKTGTVVSLERRVVLTPKPEESKRDGKPHGISFYEIRFKTFPADDPRGNPGFSSDIQEFHVHGGMTHLDALCHDSDNGMLYNGYPLNATVSEEKGCTKLGLDNLKEGIVTRGILVDLTRLKSGSPRPPGSRAYPEDIEAWEKQTGLEVSPGDALFVYSPGARAGAGTAASPSGGFDVSVAPWLKTRGVAVTSGIRPIPDDRHADHRLPLVALGVYLLDGVVLDQLAETAARLNRWEFMLVVAPLQVPGSTGSPVNPLAMF
jgi:kynurenine formamidase